MDHGFVRPKEDWELSDGIVFLLRECASVESLQPFVIKNLENLSNLCYIDHFKHANTLKENLFKSLIVLWSRMGKKQMRQHVDLFLDPVFRAAKSREVMENNMTFAAQDLILAIEKLYGENIFRAIVEGFDDRLLPELERIKQEGSLKSNQDFIYPPRGGPIPNNNYGIGSGQGAVAGQLNPGGVGGPEVMTKAPWAK